jgi:AcrR family transcriptional regulator
MMSSRHNDPEEALLDAARASLLAVGWRRTTLTDVARRAGVSRMTIYRKWPDMRTLLADLMTREWSAVFAGAALSEGATPLERLATGVARTVGALRDNELFRKIVDVDPELLLPYLLDRRGRTQDSVLELTQSVILEGQKGKSIRTGEPALLARTVLLAAHGFALSAATMTESSGPTVPQFDAELRTMVERYLAP